MTITIQAPREADNLRELIEAEARRQYRRESGSRRQTSLATLRLDGWASDGSHSIYNGSLVGARVPKGGGYPVVAGVWARVEWQDLED